MVLARDAELKFVALQYVVLCHKTDKKYAGIHKKKLYILREVF